PQDLSTIQEQILGLPLKTFLPNFPPIYLQSIMNAAARLIHLTNRSVSATPLCQSLHWPPLGVLHPSLPIPPLASIQCPPSLSANPSTGLHSVSSTPLCQSLHWPPLGVLQSPPPLGVITPLCQSPSTGLHSVSSTPLCQSLHWPPLRCPPPLSANPSTGLHSVSSTPLCQSLHWPPLSVLHPSLPIPPLASHCPT
ncbi:unnamed protein product, partial [Staurois parvus]